MGQADTLKQSLRQLAAWGEDLAAETLTRQGCRLVGRNVRTPYGELDLIVERELPGRAPLTIFVEVKTRRSTTFGYPEQAITPLKRAHLLAAAQEYIRLHPEIRGEWRVDVIAILRPDPQQPPEIRIFENAVTAD